MLRGREVVISLGSYPGDRWFESFLRNQTLALWESQINLAKLGGLI